MIIPREQQSLRSLRRRWSLTALLCALFLLTFHRLLLATWEKIYADRWLGLAGIALAYLLFVLWRGLSHNRRPGEAGLLPWFGSGNAMTLLRGALLAALTGFLFAPWPPDWLAWAPGILYMLAALADFLDGYLARVTHYTTRMGEILDMSFDGWGVLVASLLAIQYGQVPGWYMAVALARPAFLVGIWLRQRLQLPVHELQPSVRRRAFAGVQMGFLFFVLMPVFSPPGTSIAAAVFALPFLVGFVIDWLGVYGRVKSQHSAGETKLDPRKDLLLRWLPVGLRFSAVILLAGQLISWSSAGGVSSTSTAMLLMLMAQTTVMLLLALGVSGRIAAILGLCIVGIQQTFTGLMLGSAALLVILTAILYLGTGSLSLWQPEERLIHQRAGERPS